MLAHFIIKIKKDLSDIVESRDILAVTPYFSNSEAKLSLVFTGEMEGSRLKAKDR
jgi:hypothetical protein